MLTRPVIFSFWNRFMAKRKPSLPNSWPPLSPCCKLLSKQTYHFSSDIFTRFFSRIVYFMGVSLTSGVFISERQQGLLDRCMVAGIFPHHACKIKYVFPILYLYYIPKFPIVLFYSCRRTDDGDFNEPLDQSIYSDDWPDSAGFYLYATYLQHSLPRQSYSSDLYYFSTKLCRNVFW